VVAAQILLTSPIRGDPGLSSPQALRASPHLSPYVSLECVCSLKAEEGFDGKCCNKEARVHFRDEPRTGEVQNDLITGFENSYKLLLMMLPSYNGDWK